MTNLTQSNLDDLAHAIARANFHEDAAALSPGETLIVDRPVAYVSGVCSVEAVAAEQEENHKALRNKIKRLKTRSGFFLED